MIAQSARPTSAVDVRLDEFIPRLDYGKLAPDLRVFNYQRVCLQLPGTTLFFSVRKVGRNWFKAPSIGRLRRKRICSIVFEYPVQGDLEQFVGQAVRITCMNGLQATMMLHEIGHDAVGNETLVLGREAVSRHQIHSVTLAP